MCTTATCIIKGIQGDKFAKHSASDTRMGSNGIRHEQMHALGTADPPPRVNEAVGHPLEDVRSVSTNCARGSEQAVAETVRGAGCQYLRGDGHTRILQRARWAIQTRLRIAQRGHCERPRLQTYGYPQEGCCKSVNRKPADPMDAHGRCDVSHQGKAQAART